jgi:hypothetical protein
MKINYIRILILLILESFTLQQNNFEGNLVCGNVPPKNADDCLIANLDSGFRCCHVTKILNKPDTCVLLSDYQRKNGSYLNSTTPLYYCGLSGSYIKYSLGFMLAVIYLLF